MANTARTYRAAMPSEDRTILIREIPKNKSLPRRQTYYQSNLINCRHFDMYNTFYRSWFSHLARIA